jgi:hypothetical protein
MKKEYRLASGIPVALNRHAAVFGNWNQRSGLDHQLRSRSSHPVSHIASEAGLQSVFVFCVHRHRDTKGYARSLRVSVSSKTAVLVRKATRTSKFRGED